MFKVKVQNGAPFRRPLPGPPYGHGPNPHRGIRVRAKGIFPPEAMTGHPKGSPELCFWHPSWPPELATRTAFWPPGWLATTTVFWHPATATALRHPTWSPVRCFGTRGGHQNGGATSELAWEGRLEVRNGRILVKVIISRGGVTSNFGRITPHQALMHIVNPRPFLRGGGGPSPNLGARLG